jgi:hypothetical protein
MLIYTPSGMCSRVIWSFLMTCYTDAHISCTNLHSHRQYKRAPRPPPPHFISICWFSWWLSFWLVWDGISVALISIFFMAKDAEDFSIHLFSISMSCSENCSFVHSLIGLWVFLMFNFLSSFYILDINPCILWVAGKYFLPFCGLSLHSPNCFLWCAEGNNL